LPSCLLSSLQLPYQEPDNPSFYPWKTAVTCFVQEIKTLNSRPPVWLPTLTIHKNQGLSKRRMITPWNLIPNQQMVLERELSNTSQQQNPCMPIIFGDYSHLEELTFPQWLLVALIYWCRHGNRQIEKFWTMHLDFNVLLSLKGVISIYNE
jgi:hypothetical protein